MKSQKLTFPSTRHRLDPRFRPLDPRREEIRVRHASGINV